MLRHARHVAAPARRLALDRASRVLPMSRAGVSLLSPRAAPLSTDVSRWMKGPGDANPMIGVFVTVTVPEDVREEFLQVMQADMDESRKEPGCMRFDLLDQGDGVYSFYEAYKDASDLTTHKTTPHYKGWAEFKKANPAVAQSQTVVNFTFLKE